MELLDLAVIDAALAARVERDMFSGCLRCTGYRHDADGYATITRERKSWRVHRYVWTKLRGPIPPGHVLDHVRERGCVFRDCIDLDHLEPVSVTINAKRVVPWNSRKTHCPRGHDFETFAVYRVRRDGRVRRDCDECARERARARRAQARRAVLPMS
jgi:hypothetical protein